MRIDIDLVQEVTDELVDAVGRLLPQLSDSATPVNAKTVRDIVEWQSNRLLVARVDGAVAGMLTLVMFPIPSGLRARIEDLVVDQAARGRGVGTALTLAAAHIAHTDGVRTLDLTSRPSRRTANRLYERLGFRRRDSRLYRMIG